MNGVEKPVMLNAVKSFMENNLYDIGKRVFYPGFRSVFG